MKALSDPVACFIDPVTGLDANSGFDRARPWRTFAPLNRRTLAPGDRVEILAPGPFHESLVLQGQGTAAAPITVHFAPGHYDFYPTHAEKRRYYISNTNGDPEGEKAIGILVEQARHIHISGPGARIVFRGKMIEVCLDHAEAITLSDLQFDYHRPTVSEFTVVSASDRFADLRVHRDSAYGIEDRQLVWEGEGWRCEPQGRRLLAQRWDPVTELLERCPNPLTGLAVEEQDPFMLRVHGDHGLTAGHVYQLRDTFRDGVGFFMNRCRDVILRDIHFYFLHGMGILCQFTENITLASVAIAPDPESGRTSAAWADCFHASGCRGLIRIQDCVFDGAHDDAINIHGTYLRVMEALPDHRIRVRFMHPQTYGFRAFDPGDEIAFVRWDTLETYASNHVTVVAMTDPYALVLTLAKPMPGGWHAEDVIENVTWTPEVEIHGCTVRHIPTRGFLLSTRRRTVVTDNVFIRPRRNGIHVGGEAEKWFESGCVMDMEITRNRFVRCGAAAIQIRPHKPRPNPAVHRHIRIADNDFVLAEGLAVDAGSITGLTIAGNILRSAVFSDPQDAMKIDECSEIMLKNNHLEDLRKTP